MSEPDAPGRLLFARLQLAVPSARDYLLTTVRDEAPLDGIVRDLQRAIIEAGYDADIVADLTAASQQHRPANNAFRLIQSPGLLIDGRTLLLAARAGATVLVILRGRTVRRELEMARRELASAGGVLAAAVLVE